MSIRVTTIKARDLDPEHVGKTVSIDFSWDGSMLDGTPNPQEAYSYKQVGILLGFRDDKSMRRDARDMWPTPGDKDYRLEVILDGYPEQLRIDQDVEIKVYNP